MFSGALPISRDTPSYAAIMSILNGGEAGQLDYARNYRRKNGDDGEEDGKDDDDDWLASSRAEAKSGAGGATGSRPHPARGLGGQNTAGGKGVDDPYNNNSYDGEPRSSQVYMVYRIIGQTLMVNIIRTDPNGL